MSIDIEALEKKLIESNRRYHNKEEPLMSDDEYDTTRRYVLEHKPDSVLATMVGAPPATGSTITHRTPMYSLDDFFDVTDLPAIIQAADKERSLIVELKFDGIAASCVWEHGQLRYVATRGDGSVGDNITASCKHVAGIPTTIDHTTTLEVRGEIILPHAAFAAIQAERSYMNPRNAVAGILRASDPDYAKGVGLVFVPYEIPVVDSDVDDYGQLLSMVDALGIGALRRLWPAVWRAMDDMVAGYCYSRQLTLQDVIARVQEMRNTLPFDIDGLVLKARSLAHRMELGASGRVPKWGVAFKYPGSTGITTIEFVDWQVSRNGVLTPVAKVAPVYIGGANYTSVTLHNMSEIERLGVHVGAKVLIERRGDVIPKVMQVLEAAEKASKSTHKPPLLCPVCQGLVTVDRATGSPVARCTSGSCFAQMSGRIIHYASRMALDINGLGEETVRQLVRHKRIMDVSDLYRLTPDSFKGLEGWADTSTTNLLQAIQDSYKRPLDKFVYGLGIQGVGQGTARHIAESLGSVEAMMPYMGNAERIAQWLSSFTRSQLDSVAQDGVKAWMMDARNTELLRKLIDAGGAWRMTKVVTGTALANTSWVVTGTIVDGQPVPRDAVHALIRQHGGQVSSTVSKNTTGLIVGDHAGSKRARAEKLGVACYTYDELRRHIANNQV